MWSMMYIECVNIFRVINFMSREVYKVNFYGRKVNFNFICSLCCIDMEEDFVCMSNFINCCNIGYRINFVVYYYK